MKSFLHKSFDEVKRGEHVYLAVKSLIIVSVRVSLEIV